MFSEKKINLRIPGPTPCPQEVLEAMSGEMIDHRGPEFAQLIQSVTSRLKQVYKTQNDVLILTASGTGAMEAAIVNILSPGDHILTVSIGAFGERFVAIAKTYGAHVHQLQFKWGTAADPDAITRILTRDAQIKAVFVTHNETSTGVTNDLAAISKAVLRYEKLLIVDAISSLGCIDLDTDRWGCDVVASASQKGWMAPPGLAFISMSARAWHAYQRAEMPKIYWDLGKALNFLEKGQTPWTPAVSIFYALDKSLELMLKEGLSNIFERHKRVAQRVRVGLEALGLSLFADKHYASNTVTSVNSPESSELVRELRKKGVVVAGGQGMLEGKIFRIGHMGYVSEADVDECLEALKEVLGRR